MNCKHCNAVEDERCDYTMSLTSRKDRLAPHTLPPGATVDGTCCGRWVEVSGMKVPLPVPTTGPVGGDEDGAGIVGEEEDNDDVGETVTTLDSGMRGFISMLSVSVYASLVVVPTLATNILFGDVEIFEEMGLQAVVPVDGDRQGETIDSGGPK